MHIYTYIYIIFFVTIIGRTMSLSISDLVISVVAFPLLSANFNSFKIDLLGLHIPICNLLSKSCNKHFGCVIRDIAD